MSQHEYELARLRAELAQARADAVAREAELQRSHMELKAANVRLQELATTDSLTGASNRRAFDQRLAIEFALARRKQRSLSVVLLDADNFKRRNDLYGHDTGDVTLKQLAKLLQASLRESDMVVRYGGEEFVLLLPETTVADALAVAERIVISVRNAAWPGERLTVSAGVAGMEEGALDGSQLVSRADEALYAAKRAGKDQALLFDVTPHAPRALELV